MAGNRIGAGGPFLVSQAVAVATLSGMFAIASTQLVLVEAQQDAVRANHNALHVFRTGFQTVGQQKQVLNWRSKTPSEEQEEYSVSKPQNIAVFRNSQPVTTTVGQPFFLWQTAKPDLSEAEDARRVNHNTLHQFRFNFQTVGQSYRLWRVVQQRLEPEEYTIPKAVDITVFRNSQSAAAQPGQPFSLWPKTPRYPDELEDIKRVDHTLIHALRWPLHNTLAYASGTQLVLVEAVQDAIRSNHNLLHAFRNVPQPDGSRVWVINDYHRWIEEETYDIPKAVDLTPLRGKPIVAQPGQPFFLWPKAVSDQSVESDAIRQDHGLLHRYRTGYQTVGQSWQYWIKPPQRVEAEDYTVPPPAPLQPYRQITVTVPPGQPWYMWPKAVSDQSVEPNPVVTDHAAALYPFRPHPAIPPEPAVVDGVFPGSGYPVDWQGNRRKLRLEEQPEKHLRHILDKVVAEYYGEILDSDAPRAAKAKAAAAVRPYVSTGSSGARLPKPARVNWELLQQDADAVATLIAIWSSEVARDADNDDEEFFMLMS